MITRRTSEHVHIVSEWFTVPKERRCKHQAAPDISVKTFLGEAQRGCRLGEQEPVACDCHPARPLQMRVIDASCSLAVLFGVQG